ncbi:acyl-CoA thioesterase/BAAT N-terminal domain-containing protein [Kitasatospora sp. NBC_00240]|uniref:acyl-CoA thioesterase/BAAT N-terminal domain-containing protein n=1 Tax=Kitasatospora sp. NBC_00240 TaxID=2903567 RepID=UPI002252517A|nr:acyl-CoA thioesterase/BAAT N-terminal domain-containing protein [Kitasatospora sp. NBC_00240]MCX5214560.1 acyl-CoA thioesterase/BAAT N-terminal domain-containing protein [Kitasatospora sp. NBC_00240]
MHLRVTGLAADDEVTVASAATDYAGKEWQGHALFRADADGAVALDSAVPLSGTYRGADGMGLFWSMDPPTGNPDQSAFVPIYPELKHSYDVRITVTAHGRRLATRTLSRQFVADGVSTRTLTLAMDQVIGELFLPPAGAPGHPAVLVFGGSEGGNSQKYTAALLASHGYPALALGYFALPGLPATLHDIPLEYFATAARLLAAQPGTDPAHVVAMGYSRGSEAALLLGENYPALIHGAVVYSPSAQVNPGLPGGGNAWTKDSRPIAQETIPLGQVSGPVLALAGADDLLWPSPMWTRQINQELAAANDSRPHEELIYPNAGHGVGTFPYLPAGTRTVNPTSGRLDDLGGTRAGNAAAQSAGWPKVLALLAEPTS